MNNLNSIGDEEFIPFLNNLGVDTYSKSFEWMLSDPEFGEVLRWIYNHLNHNNALSTREECRYVEIEKKGKVLSSEDLERTLTSIQQEYSDISLPGDLEAIEDVKLDTFMQEERLTVLERHDNVLKDLLRQNDIIKQELDMEMIKLNTAQLQGEEDEAVAAKECLQLDDQMDGITNSVIDVIADTLNIYSSCCKDKETAKRFLTFSPMYITYRQSQSLFRSHFDLYTTKKFDKRSDDITEDDMRAALAEAKSIEARLSDTLYAYIESNIELSGEQAKLALVSNYSNVHPSQVTSCVMEAQSSLELLEQDESILQQQVRNAAEQLVESRTSLAVATATNHALVIREQISKDLSFLLEITQQALAVDRLVYCALRHELRSLEELLHFALHLQLYVTEERAAVAGRLQSMKDIIAEQECAERALETDDRLLNALCSVLGVQSKDAVLVVQSHADMSSRLRELMENITEGFKNKERSLELYKMSTKPLADYIYDGCTRQPNCHDRSLSAMAHALGLELERVDKIVLEASGLFQAVKKSNKSSLRKLWQWFLTDPARLFAAVESVQTRSC